MKESSSINELCKECFAVAESKGWWERERNEAEAIALMHSELSEALEAAREHKPIEDFVEELADCCIRIFDYCGKHGYDLEGALMKKIEKNRNRPHRHGNKKY
jgi:NTP pyrophosphatase (non-canonical NTP hydrolase)